MATILVVDDEPNIVELNQLYLENAGYRVLTAYDGKSALQMARTQRPDLMVLDLMLPEIDGFDVCRRLQREDDEMPIIMLTARDDDVDKIVGLELGADDYMTKPFNPRELVARVKAVLRRADRPSKQRSIQLGDIALDPDSREVLVDGRSVSLRLKEFDLLAALLGRPNTALSREQLLQSVWGYDFVGNTRTVDVHVARLREKIKASALSIETVWGIGYKLVEK